MVRPPPGLKDLIALDDVYVILDIGLTYTKCGFAKDSLPKHIVPTPLSMVDEMRNSLADLRQNSFHELFANKKKLALEVEEFLAQIFYHLL